MGKKDSKDKKKKEEKKKKEKKDKKKKDKKDKKKKEKKKSKKQESSSSSGSGSSSSASAPPPEKKRKKEDTGEAAEIIPLAPQLDNLAPPDEGIQRFRFEVEEAGPLGLRFSGGFPPMILSVAENSFASKKGVPATFEVHAINGHALVAQNQDVVMSGMKQRPVVIDVRPPGWKPKEKVKELELKRAREEAEKKARVEREEKRREQVAKEAAEQAQREASERAEREAAEKVERLELERRAREQRAIQKAKEEEFEKVISTDALHLRKAANRLMEAEYGAKVDLAGCGKRGLPLRLMTRRKEVAWMWAGETMELIGGGVQDEPADTWTEG